MQEQVDATNAENKSDITHSLVRLSALFENNLLNKEEYFGLHRQFNTNDQYKVNYFENNPNETPFDLIYRLIKTRNRHMLACLLVSGHTLNVPQGKCPSPLTLLAQENDKESILFLKKYFYNFLNKPSYFNYLIRGWAINANFDEINPYPSTSLGSEWLITGLAEGGHVYFVNERIKDVKSLKAAVVGYALGKHVNQVNAILNKPGLDQMTIAELLIRAAEGYSLAKDFINADDLLAKVDDISIKRYYYCLSSRFNELNFTPDPRILSVIVPAFIRTGQIGVVKMLIKNCSPTNCYTLLYSAAENFIFFGFYNALLGIYSIVETRDNDNKKFIWQHIIYLAVQGCHLSRFKLLGRLVNQTSKDNLPDFYRVVAEEFKKTTYLTRKNVLETLSQINNKDLRQHLAESHDKTKFLEEAIRINTIINKFNVYFKQAKSIVRNKNIIELYLWFFNGLQLVKNGTFPFEVYLHIATCLTGLDATNTRAIYDAVHNKFLANSTSAILKKYQEEKNQQGFFSTPQYLKEIEKVEQDYVKRFYLRKS